MDEGVSAVPFYVTSRIYNPSDQGRIAPDNPEIGYDWVSSLRSNRRADREAIIGHYVSRALT
jgi:dTDP-4-dehydrorhamnose 3,5-epimerase-like enzyme